MDEPNEELKRKLIINILKMLSISDDISQQLTTISSWELSQEQKDFLSLELDNYNKAFNTNYTVKEIFNFVEGMAFGIKTMEYQIEQGLVDLKANSNNSNNNNTNHAFGDLRKAITEYKNKVSIDLPATTPNDDIHQLGLIYYLYEKAGIKPGDELTQEQKDTLQKELVLCNKAFNTDYGLGELDDRVKWMSLGIKSLSHRLAQTMSDVKAKSDVVDDLEEKIDAATEEVKSRLVDEDRKYVNNQNIATVCSLVGSAFNMWANNDYSAGAIAGAVAGAGATYFGVKYVSEKYELDASTETVKTADIYAGFAELGFRVGYASSSFGSGIQNNLFSTSTTESVTSVGEGVPLAIEKKEVNTEYDPLIAKALISPFDN